MSRDIMCQHKGQGIITVRIFEKFAYFFTKQFMAQHSTVGSESRSRGGDQSMMIL